MTNTAKQERSSRLWDTVVGSIAGFIGTVAGGLALGNKIPAFGFFQDFPTWVTWSLLAVMVIAIVIAIPRTRRRLWRVLCWVGSFRPITVRRSRRLLRKAAERRREVAGRLSERHREQLDAVHRAHSTARTSYETSITGFSKELQKVREEKLAAEATFKREIDGLRRQHEHEKVAIAQRNSEQVRETLELGKELGRNMALYSDDWEHLSPVQRAEAKQKAQRREARERTLEKTNAELLSRLSADQDEHQVALKEQFEAGRKEGYSKAWQEVEERLAEDVDDDSGAPVPASPKPLLPTPRWRIYRQSTDDPNDDGWIIYNPVDGCGIKNLRVDAERERFTIRSAGDWRNVDGVQIFEFHGVPTRTGRQFGFDFTLTWDMGDGWPRTLKLDPEEEDDDAVGF
jgi:hypothetical protein